MSTQPVASTIATRSRDETRIAQVQAPDLLVAGTAELRRDVDDPHGNVEGLHRDMQETQLSHLIDGLNLLAPQDRSTSSVTASVSRGRSSPGSSG